MYHNQEHSSGNDEQSMSSSGGLGKTFDSAVDLHENPWSGTASMPHFTRSPPVNIPSASAGPSSSSSSLSSSTGASNSVLSSSLSSRLRSVSDLRSAGKITPQQRNILKDMILEEGSSSDLNEAYNTSRNFANGSDVFS